MRVKYIYCVVVGTVRCLEITLIGHHPLWAHCLWNAGVYLAQYFDKYKEIVRGKTFGSSSVIVF